MNKLEFINALGDRLSLLPPGEVKGILDYYVESIDDRMEDGMDEAAAIDSLGPIDELAAKILSEQEHLTPPAAPEPPRFDAESDSAPKPPHSDAAPVFEPGTPPQKRRMSPGIIVLLVIGSPIWFSLGVAAFSVALAIYIVAWVLLASLSVVAAALILGGLLGAVASLFISVYPNTIAMRVLSLGGCLVCAGLGFLLLPATVWLIRGFVRLHSLSLRALRARKETV